MVLFSLRCASTGLRVTRQMVLVLTLTLTLAGQKDYIHIPFLFSQPVTTATNTTTTTATTATAATTTANMVVKNAYKSYLQL